jgi:flavin-dependent dehydrogenase
VHVPGEAGGVTEDLLVLGGGPVGLGTAVLAAQAGMSVVLVEQRQPPVDKACGEGLMPPAVAALRELGVEPRGMPFRGIRYVADGAAATAYFRNGSGMGVRRTALSAALSARVEQLGVRRVQAAAGPPVQGDGWVEAAGIRSRWLVAADGLHSPTRRALGLDRPDSAPPRYGLRRHYRVAPWSDVVEVHWSAEAEAYITPVAADVVGVALLGPRGTGFERVLRGFPQVLRHLDGASPVSPVRGAGPLRRTAARRVHGRVLLVGDASGYVDALTGEGISVGLACARALVDSLVAGDPAAYERAWWRATRRYRVLTRSLLWAAARPGLRRAIVPAAQRLPIVFSAIVNQLS